MDKDINANGVILLVDDELNVLKALARSLHRLKYRVIKCSNPTEALEKLSEEKVDLVISDHLMPGMKGMDFLVEVRKLYPSVVRILLTGHADVDVAIDGINSGKLFRFLTKPWDDEELRKTVEKGMSLSRIQRKSREIVSEVHKQDKELKSLENRFPGISSIKRDKSGAIIIDDDED